jgi:hypothetical protein
MTTMSPIWMTTHRFVSPNTRTLTRSKLKVSRMRRKGRFSPNRVDTIPNEESTPTNEEPVPLQSPLPNEAPLARPLTPISDCLEVGFPAESIRTAAGIVAETDFIRQKHIIGMSILAHAKIYSFASRHFFSDLAKFALQRLSQILNLAPCEYDSLFPELADAIRHIYDTTPGPELQQDPARKLLSQYVALNYTKLVGEDLDTLAREGKELMVDVSNKLVRLLATTSVHICSIENKITELSTKVEAWQVICDDKEKEIQRLGEELEEARERKEDADPWGIGSSKSKKKRAS